MFERLEASTPLVLALGRVWLGHHVRIGIFYSRAERKKTTSQYDDVTKLKLELDRDSFAKFVNH